MLVGTLAVEIEARQWGPLQGDRSGPRGSDEVRGFQADVAPILRCSPAHGSVIFRHDQTTGAGGRHVCVRAQGRLATPSIKQHLAAIRMLFDWLVTGQVLPANPAASVKAPKHVVKKSKTPVLSAQDTRTLLDSIATEREDDDGTATSIL